MKFLRQYFPKNYLIKNPFHALFILTLFSFLFIYLYHPFELNHDTKFNFNISILLFCSGGSISYAFFILFMNYIFSRYMKNGEWSLQKEIIIIFSGLTLTGIVTHFLGYLINSYFTATLKGLIEACKMIYLIYGIPFIFSTFINFTRIRKKNISENKKNQIEKITISSHLKEKLSFHPENFIYAEASGNYVDFYMYSNNKMYKKTIRSSLNYVEKQLSDSPYILKTHRAYIVNLLHIKEKKGNTLGYKLKLNQTDTEIPVSRTNINDFNEAFRKLKQ